MLGGAHLQVGRAAPGVLDPRQRRPSRVHTCPPILSPTPLFSLPIVERRPLEEHASDVLPGSTLPHQRLPLNDSPLFLADIVERRQLEEHDSDVLPGPKEPPAHHRVQRPGRGAT
eukprot:291977-Chlamydomonas_euryale.AAC.1